MICFSLSPVGCCSVIVGPRILFKQVVATGIFSGAKVIRGHDWKWKNQDGMLNC